MTVFEYKVVPAPVRGLKTKGVKGTPARFANALQTVMNEFGADGWEYQRTDTLPVQERQGLTGTTTTFQNMLVFRRVVQAEADATLDVAALIEDRPHVQVRPPLTPAKPAIAEVQPVAPAVDPIDTPPAQPKTDLRADAADLTTGDGGPRAAE